MEFDLHLVKVFKFFPFLWLQLILLLQTFNSTACRVASVLKSPSPEIIHIVALKAWNIFKFAVAGATFGNLDLDFEENFKNPPFDKICMLFELTTVFFLIQWHPVLMTVKVERNINFSWDHNIFTWRYEYVIGSLWCWTLNMSTRVTNYDVLYLWLGVMSGLDTTVKDKITK